MRAGVRSGADYGQWLAGRVVTERIGAYQLSIIKAFYTAPHEWIPDFLEDSDALFKWIPDFLKISGAYPHTSLWFSRRVIISP